MSILTSRDQKDEDTDSESRWEDHVGEARKVVRDELQLGRPPADLHEVLAGYCQIELVTDRMVQ